jgi:hypothetical protein
MIKFLYLIIFRIKKNLGETFLRVLAHIYFFAPMEIYIFVIFVLYRRISQLFCKISQTYLKPSGNFDFSLLETFKNFSDITIFVNRSLGGQFFVTSVQNITSLVLLLFIFAFKAAGKNLEVTYSTLEYMTIVLFYHTYIFIPSLLGDLIERKV